MLRSLLQVMFSTAGSEVSFLPLAPALQSYAMCQQFYSPEVEQHGADAPTAPGMAFT